MTSHDSQTPSQQDPGQSFTALFVRRPIFALVLNTLIVVAGLAAFNGVEIRELPVVDQPVISVHHRLRRGLARDGRP
jgi:HAE1 family hydrophobic/amphiphilic exporter-1